ncbi:hypothetical protein VTN77DRAFT_4491 [Rasamsonia byssochlamydoides]|uniref:uncharacterized protein n=1 Tax=Rasamsonia byssochlamydoides TaxID=89139 RepID=UPI0037447F11
MALIWNHHRRPRSRHCCRRRSRLPFYSRYSCCRCRAVVIFLECASIVLLATFAVTSLSCIRECMRYRQDYGHITRLQRTTFPTD